MKVSEIASLIEAYAPLSLQEDWDNAGIQVGDPQATVTGVLLCTDVTEAVVAEAIDRGMNMVVSHHPLIFHGLKKVMGRNPVERTVAMAIKHDITIYSAHTNMDNAPGGVSWLMAQKIGMTDVEVLDAHTDAATGKAVGSGVIGNVAATPARDLIARIKTAFEGEGLRYSGNVDAVVTRVALCGGAGAFLINNAIAAGAQLFVSADMRYHDFLEYNDRLVLADIGHYESEHFTKEIFYRLIQEKNPTFAVAFAKQERNQIHYL